MLEIRPNCECCNKDLPADSVEAMICTDESTFCLNCVDGIIKEVCQNCGGGVTQRPIRPIVARRAGLSLRYQQASTERITTKFSFEELKEFSDSVKDIAPEDR
jgi:hypothetical protein